MIKENIKAEEVVESIARMDANEREKFVRDMVWKWPALTREITTALDNELYDMEHYG
tara:strand:- start:547 stop:717 length:171 start_codon:yes stop_codon:yes gene_type:complete